ncbi:MAG: CPBP family intramembrane glutamic endopeptidase [Candidatus Acidiferrum sp.]
MIGAVLLFVSPRFPWYPNALILAAKAVPSGLNSVALRENFYLLSVYLYPMVFAGLLAYLTCFYPGPKPVRRILWLVLLPTLLSLTLIFPILYRISRPSTSVLEPAAPLSVALQWLRSNIWDFPVGLHFCVFSLLLILVFMVRLQSGKSSLSLAMPLISISSDQPPDSWNSTRLLVFILLCPLFLIDGLLGLPLILTSILSSHPLSSTYLTLGRIIAALMDAGVLVALALLMLGQSGRKMVRNLFQLPQPHDAFFALLLPIGLAGLLSAPSYLIARTNWVIYAIHETSAPQFAYYFDLTRVKDPWLLLMAIGAFAEEFVFRGLLLHKLVSRYDLHRGIFLTGIIWAAYHFRGDSYAGLSVGGVLLHLANRILFCLALNYALAWMTLRWKSIIPAGIAHTVSNMLVVAGVNHTIPWSDEFRILEWALVALLLFRYWPYDQTEPVQTTPTGSQFESAI